MAWASVSPTVAGSKPKKLLDQTRDVLRLEHYSLPTERSYCDWIERCDDLRRPAVSDWWVPMALAKAFSAHQ